MPMSQNPTPKRLAALASQSLRRLAKNGPPPERSLVYALDARSKREFIERVMPDIQFCRQNGIKIAAIYAVLREEVGVEFSIRTLHRVMSEHSR